MKPNDVLLIHNIQFEIQEHQKKLTPTDAPSMFMYKESDSIRKLCLQLFTIHKRDKGESMEKTFIHSEPFVMSNNVVDEVGQFSLNCIFDSK
jgi:hypothetical protein